MTKFAAFTERERMFDLLVFKYLVIPFYRASYRHRSGVAYGFTKEHALRRLKKK